MMDKKVKGKTKFTAYAYRPYSPGFAAPLGPATIPGPLLEAEVGDTIVVNFRNKIDAPVTMHPHGVFYAPGDGRRLQGQVHRPRRVRAEKPDLPVRLGGARGHRGRLALPRPRADGPAAGLQGPVRAAASSARPGRRRRRGSSSSPSTPSCRRSTGLNRSFSCINGRAYAGNTPTLRGEGRRRASPSTSSRSTTTSTPSTSTATAGPTPDGTVVDNKTLGPGDSFTARVHRGQPRPLVLPLPRVLPSARGDERLVPRQLRPPGRRSRAAVLAVALALATGGERREPAGRDLQLPVVGRRRSRSTSASTSPGTGSGPDTVHSVTGDVAERARDRLRRRHQPAPPPDRRQLRARLRQPGHLRVRLQAAQHGPRHGDRLRHPGRPGRGAGPGAEEPGRPAAPEDAPNCARQEPDPRPRRPAARSPSTSGRRSTPTTTGSTPEASDTSPAGRNGTPTSASMRSASAGAGSTSARSLAVTSPSCAPPTATTTPARRGRSGSRSPRAPRVADRRPLVRCAG